MTRNQINHSNQYIIHHANDRNNQRSFLKFRGNIKTLRQRANSAARGKLWALHIMICAESSTIEPNCYMCFMYYDTMEWQRPAYTRSSKQLSCHGWHTHHQRGADSLLDWPLTYWYIPASKYTRWLLSIWHAGKRWAAGEVWRWPVQQNYQ